MRGLLGSQRAGEAETGTPGHQAKEARNWSSLFPAGRRPPCCSLLSLLSLSFLSSSVWVLPWWQARLWFGSGPGHRQRLPDLLPVAMAWALNLEASLLRTCAGGLC